MSKEITRQEAALAWAQGKRVEACSPVNSIWCLVTPVGAAVERCPRNQYPADVFTSDIPFRFRLAPTPVPHIRSWEPLEVPIGALIKHDQWNLAGLTYMICGVEQDQVVWMTSAGPGKQKLIELLRDTRWRHSVDSGRTWHPCGVKVVR